MATVPCLCVACGHRGTRIALYCPGCGGKNTLCEAPAEASEPKTVNGDARGVLVRASSARDVPPRRVRTGLASWDDLLGDGAGALGVVVPSSVLVAGGAGVGKTTQAACAASHIAKHLRGDALFVSAEMPRDLAITTARRGGASLEHLVVMAESDGHEIFAAVERTRPKVVLYDSIQRIAWRGRTGTEHSMRAVLVGALDRGQRFGLVSLIISQLNSDGRPAGPNFLAHDPDTVLFLGPNEIRTGTKHRHGVACRSLPVTATPEAAPERPRRASGVH